MIPGAEFSLAAMLHIVGLSNAAISPDGAKIAFVTTRADPAHNAYRDRLWAYEVRGRRALPINGEHRSYASPQWSPDGTQLAFIADDKATHNDQLFLLNPATGKARRLTSGKSSVDEFAWRPNNRAIAFVRLDTPAAEYGTAAFEDAFEVTDNDYLATKPAMPRHLWLVDVATNKERRLSEGAWSVVDSTISWSPDGTRLAYLRAANGIRGNQDRDAAYALDVATGVSRPVTPHPLYEDHFVWSPDGRRALYLYAREGDPMNEADAMSIASDGSDDRDLSRALDRHVETATWMPSGDAILLKVYDGTSGPLVVQPLLGPARRLPMGEVVDAEIGATQAVARNGTIAFVGAEAARPAELYLLVPGAAAPQRLTEFNAAVATLHLGRTTTVRWENDGFSEQGVLTYPPSYVPGKPYPLVLRIHGGPTETSQETFSSFNQLAAARGYLVFSPNYRGSSNLGTAFEHAIYDDASAGPGRDIMAGISAVEKLGIVDPSRVGVSGWSYGGQLTSWMIGHYQIWKCAVTGAAVNDLVVDYTIIDTIDDDRNALGGTPFVGDALEKWREQSPITYFKDIHTPLLMLGNVYDVRVPIVEQYELFHALRDNHVPVQFFAYPTTGHLPKGPVRLADAYRRWLDWFDRFLK